MLTIGLDPHPDSHTVAALDENGFAIRSITVSNTPDGLSQLYGLRSLFTSPLSLLKTRLTVLSHRSSTNYSARVRQSSTSSTSPCSFTARHNQCVIPPITMRISSSC